MKNKLIDDIEWLEGLQNPAWENEDYASIERVCEAARSTLSHPDVAGWMPIESAPKDGRRIITWSKKGGVRENYVMQEKGIYKGMWAKSPTGTEPTHWQPLQKPPTSETENE